jgi:ATP-dependent RNA helicase DeaD
VAALLLQRALATRPAGESLTRVELGEATATAPPRADRRGGAMTLFEINLGAKDNAEANWILPLICRRGGITRREVGAIRVTRDRTVFEIDARVAAEFAANASERDPRAPHVRITPASAGLPERSFTPPRHPGKTHKPRRPGRS